MAQSFHQGCPTKGCKLLSEVYVNEDRVPESDTPFQYQCPACEQTIVAYPKAFTANVEIPADAIVATRVPKS